MIILIACFGYALLAVTNLLDKFIVSTRLSPVLFGFYASIIALPLLALAPFGAPLKGSEYLIALLSGAAFLGALIAMYQGFMTTEVSHSGPLAGATTTLGVVLLSTVFLQEALSVREWWGVGILTLASALISFEYTRRSFAVPRAMGWLVVAGLCFAVSHVAAKYLYDQIGFFTGFVWTRGMLGVAALPLLFAGTVRRGIFSSPDHAERIRSSFSLVLANRATGILGVTLVQWAIAGGSVVVVNALQGIQYALLLVLTLAVPRFFSSVKKEETTPVELLQEGGSILLMALGLGLVL